LTLIDSLLPCSVLGKGEEKVKGNENQGQVGVRKAEERNQGQKEKLLESQAARCDHTAAKVQIAQMGEVVKFKQCQLKAITNRIKFSKQNETFKKFGVKSFEYRVPKENAQEEPP